MIRRLVIYGVIIIVRLLFIVIKFMNFDVVDGGNVCLMLVKFNSNGNINVLFMFRIKKIFYIVFIIGDELNNRLFIV